MVYIAVVAASTSGSQGRHVGNAYLIDSCSYNGRSPAKPVNPADDYSVSRSGQRSAPGHGTRAKRIEEDADWPLASFTGNWYAGIDSSTDSDSEDDRSQAAGTGHRRR